MVGKDKQVFILPEPCISCFFVWRKTLMSRIDYLEKKSGKQEGSQIGMKLCFPFSKCCKNKLNFLKWSSILIFALGWVIPVLKASFKTRKFTLRLLKKSFYYHNVIEFELNCLILCIILQWPYTFNNIGPNCEQ